MIETCRAVRRALSFIEEKVVLARQALACSLAGLTVCGTFLAGESCGDTIESVRAVQEAPVGLIEKACTALNACND